MCLHIYHNNLLEHLHKIFKVCASTPDTKHWLPTREPWVQKIEKEKQRISLSYKQTMENPWESFEKKHPVGSEIVGSVINTNEYAVFLKAENRKFISSSDNQSE